MFKSLNSTSNDNFIPNNNNNNLISPCGGICDCTMQNSSICKDTVTIDDLLCRDGPILKVLQFSDIEKDSKHLLDRPLKVSPNIILEEFYRLPDHTSLVLAEFLNKYFDEPGEDLELWIPPDLPKEDLSFLKSSHLSSLEASTAHEAIIILGCLGRKVKKEDAIKSSNRTILDISHGFIIPGGRFREPYYWDSYWIIRGLLISCMYDTARGMLQNYCDVISNYGFIPNGLRKYYLDRSHPPVFSLMLSDYYQATNDLKFLESSYPFLQKEYNYFMDSKNDHVLYIHFEKDSFQVKDIYKEIPLGYNNLNENFYILNRYTSMREDPRPESYKEDYAIQKSYMHNPTYAKYLMKSLRAGGESGWDFSSRWYKVSDKSRWSLDSIDTLNILPVDLNTLLYLLEKHLSEWALILSNLKQTEKIKLSEMYSNAATKRKVAMRALMWDSKIFRWCDYLCREKCISAIPNLASIWPLWAGLTIDEKELENAVTFLIQHSGLWRDWGLATTAINSGQQWDLPNGWPPLCQVSLAFLLTCKLPKARFYGIQMLEKCLASTIEGKLNSGCFFEKYNTETCGSRGSGGEYNTQVGFGWTNAVFIEWIKYKAFAYDSDAIQHVLNAEYKPNIYNCNSYFHHLNEESYLSMHCQKMNCINSFNLPKENTIEININNDNLNTCECTQDDNKICIKSEKNDFIEDNTNVKLY